MINKVVTPVEHAFVKASTNLAGSVNERLIPKSVDLLEQFISTPQRQNVKSGIDGLEFPDSVKSYALSHGQILNLVV